MNQDAGNGREYFGAVAKALARALVKVAEDEYQRLSKELNGDKCKIANRVKSALCELKNLQSGKMPCYDDEWVPLFYSTWYQPSHINLAYSMIAAMVKKRGWDGALTKTGRLHVVDFGCGTLAMQFGVALAAADALQRGERIDSIRVDLIDRSRGMINMGRKIWDQFKDEVKENSCLTPLSAACEIVESETLNEEEIPEVRESEDRWISVIHAVYGKNKPEVKENLATLECRMAPDVGFITSHEKSSRLAGFVSPFKGDQYENHEVCVQHQFNEKEFYYLLGVRDWRQEVYHNISQYLGDCEELVEKYLDYSLVWEWPEANFLIYSRHSQL